MTRPARAARGTGSAGTVRRVAAGALWWAAVAFLAVLVVAALWPALLTPLDPLATDPSAARLPPGPGHPFGTDQIGRDVFTRVVHGASTSLAIGFGATALAALAGSVLGLASALSPRWLDGLIGRLLEVLMAFPEFLAALLMLAIIGPGTESVIVAVTVAALPAYARVARAQARLVMVSGYLRSAVILGVPPWRRALVHVIPNTAGPVVVLATIGVGTAIAAAAGLSFLGLGPQPPLPEWGLLLAEGKNHLATTWWIAFFPGLAITATVVATTVVARRFTAPGGGTPAGRAAVAARRAR